MSKAQPVVSVICITYGHEDYIAQALDSFLMQKTTFPYQILVGEDHGKDRTAEIVLEYAEKYPDIIVPFIREKNMGAQRNLIDLCNRAGTKYLAFCEGDDFWTDEYKLQKQYDLMEEHPEYAACFHNTMISADPSWYLYGYYKQDKDGNIFIPESIPNYDTTLREMRMDYYIKFGPAHTSSLFYRWNSDRVIPDWYYKHIYGDHSLVMIQVGEGLIGYIPETMSTYRRSEVGVLMYETKTDHFLKSRGSWIEMAVDLERYFIEYYNSFAVNEIRERIVQEFNNYVRYIVASDKLDLLSETYEKYAYPAQLAVKENSLNKGNLNKLKKQFSDEGLKLLLENKEMQKKVSSLLEVEISERREKKKNSIEAEIDAYLDDTEKNRDNLVWVFSQEGAWKYGGNVRHLYEHIIAFHPEIKAVWLTSSKRIIKLFEAENLPVAKIGSTECREIIGKAAVAITNCFITKSFSIRGFNKNIKVVRLGDGVSLTGTYLNKIDAGDPRLGPKSTAEAVVKHNPEKYYGITVTDENRDFFTENYRKTFLQIATNSSSAAAMESKLGIPGENIFVCGSPRSYAVRDYLGKEEKKIILVPGWRDSISEQEKYINSLLDDLNAINSFLEENDLLLDIFFSKDYLHGAFQSLKAKAEQYQRIGFFGEGRDIYSELYDYSVMVTDWSNIMYDFILHDKPVVIMETENALDQMSILYEYSDVLPGETATDWNDALQKCLLRMEDKSIDRAKRERVLNTVYDMTVNDENNAERIVAEIKRRLGI